MILAVEIENSKINFGIFDTDGSNTTTFGITADIMKTSDEYAVLIDGILNYYKIDRNEINGIALCSVVPMLTNIIYLVMKQIFPSAELIKVEKGIKTGFAIKVDNPSELGADLVANATAVMEIKANENIIKGSSVIIDVGTATTIFALNEKNEFIGGSIFPGIGMSLNSLHGDTAQLPNVSLIPPTKIIGKNSQDSIRSGVVFGTAIMIDGFIDKFAKEMNSDNINVFITGEYAQTLISLCSSKYRYIPDLTLRGLYSIYKKNSNN